MSAAAGGAGEATVRRFPWEAVIHAGFCLLRLSPETFWRLTPREFFAMTGGTRAVAGTVDRRAMEMMMMRFPDG